MVGHALDEQVNMGTHTARLVSIAVRLCRISCKAGFMMYLTNAYIGKEGIITSNPLKTTKDTSQKIQMQ